MGMEELDSLSNKILARLSLIQGPGGEFELQVIEEQTNEIIYKRNHYINNRYFQITAYITNDGLNIEAFEPAKNKYLNYPIRRGTPIQNNEKTQREIGEVVKRLKIGKVLNEETLLLGG
jgi:hypothetical protein